MCKNGAMLSKVGRFIKRMRLDAVVGSRQLRRAVAHGPEAWSRSLSSAHRAVNSLRVTSDR